MIACMSARSYPSRRSTSGDCLPTTQPQQQKHREQQRQQANLQHHPCRCQQGFAPVLATNARTIGRSHVGAPGSTAMGPLAASASGQLPLADHCAGWESHSSAVCSAGEQLKVPHSQPLCSETYGCVFIDDCYPRRAAHQRLPTDNCPLTASTWQLPTGRY